MSDSGQIAAAGAGQGAVWGDKVLWWLLAVPACGQGECLFGAAGLGAVAFRVLARLPFGVLKVWCGGCCRCLAMHAFLIILTCSRYVGNDFW